MGMGMGIAIIMENTNNMYKLEQPIVYSAIS